MAGFSNLIFFCLKWLWVKWKLINFRNLSNYKWTDVRFCNHLLWNICWQTASRPVCSSEYFLNSQQPDIQAYTSQALSHYDFHIGKKMDKMWPKVRLALLSEAKYCAVLNRFCDNYEQTLRDLAESGGFDFLSHHRDLSECKGKYSVLKQEDEKNSNALDNER